SPLDITSAEAPSKELLSPACTSAEMRSPTWMSETWMGRADFRSAWPGTARTMGAESVKVIVLSVPLSSVTTTEAPEIDLTVPTTREPAACARACPANAQRARQTPRGSSTNWRKVRISTLILLNHVPDFRVVKNCQTRVKVAGQ